MFREWVGEEGERLRKEEEKEYEKENEKERKEVDLIAKITFHRWRTIRCRNHKPLWFFQEAPGSFEQSQLRRERRDLPLLKSEPAFLWSEVDSLWTKCRVRRRVLLKVKSWESLSFRRARFLDWLGVWNLALRFPKCIVGDRSVGQACPKCFIIVDLAVAANAAERIW